MSSIGHSSNVMKDEFGWEVPIESVPLPSKGLIYTPDSVLYNTETLQIKAMTAREEDILTSQAFVKEGTVVENLIKSCLTDKSIDVNSLISGDRNALMESSTSVYYGLIEIFGYSCEHRFLKLSRSHILLKVKFCTRFTVFRTESRVLSLYALFFRLSFGMKSKKHQKVLTLNLAEK